MINILTYIPITIINFLIYAWNGLCNGISWIVSGIFAILPHMPCISGLTSTGATGTPTGSCPAASAGIPQAVIDDLNWIFPIGLVVSTFSIMVTCYIIWLGVRILLRWLKAD